MKHFKIFIFPLLMVMMDISANADDVTCPEQNLNHVQIVVGHPGISPPYKSGHVLVFKCSDVNLKMYGQRTIECQSNGKWDNPYPQCSEPICVANVTNMVIKTLPYHGVLIKPGDRLKVSCDEGRGLTLQGHDEITCQDNGEWSSPFPTCVGKSACGPPPNMNHQNADTLQMLDPKKTKYEPGEQVKYECFSTYTMEGDPHMTCLQGNWKGNFLCIAPCLASIEEMDRRKIELMMGGRERMFCSHMDHITFKCQRGNRRKPNSVGFRQQCLYGKMTLPECEPGSSFFNKK